MGSVLVLEPGMCYRIVPAGHTISLEALQKIIGGTVDVVLRVPNEHIKMFLPSTETTFNLISFCDDNGYHKELAPTWRRPTDGALIVGPIVFVSYRAKRTGEYHDETYHPLGIVQLHDLKQKFKADGMSELILDEIDYEAADMVMAGGSVAES